MTAMKSGSGTTATVDVPAKTGTPTDTKTNTATDTTPVTTPDPTSGSDIDRTLELLWDTAPRPSRGPKPGLTVDRIVDAAIRIADEEGLDALSMRRVATHLGTGAMSLYRYVPGKAELLDLMLDRVRHPEPTAGGPTGGPTGGRTGGPTEDRAPSDAPNGLPADGDWRATLESLARTTLALYRRHPWLVRVNQSRPILGPGTLDALEQVLARIRPIGLPDPELVSAVIMLDGYVVGAARTQVHQEEAERSTGLTDQEFFTAQVPALRKAMATGRYPALASLAPETFAPGFDHFEFGLQRILDGLEVLVSRRTQDNK